MKIISAVVYKPQLQTALEKKTADVFCKNLKKRSGVSLLQSKTSGKISIEFYKEDSCSEEVKALFDGITVPGKEASGSGSSTTRTAAGASLCSEKTSAVSFTGWRGF